MADETPKHYTAEARSTKFYQNIEARIQVVRVLQDKLYKLSPIDPSATEEQENNYFDQLLENVMTFFPIETRERYERFSQLEHGRIFEDGVKDFEEWHNLKRDDNVQLIDKCEKVIRGARIKRSFARGALREAGDFINNPQNALSALNFFGLQFSGEIVRIIPGRFSVHVVVGHDDFIRYAARSNQQNALALHGGGMIWNIVDSDEEKIADAAKHIGISTEQFRQEIFDHEDAHALTEAVVAYFDDLEEDYKSVDMATMRIGHWKREELKASLGSQRRITAAKEIKTRQRDMRSTLRRIIDHNWDEFIVEMLSAPTRQASVNTYYNPITSDKIRNLQPFSIRNGAVKHTEEFLLSMNSTIAGFYAKMEKYELDRGQDLRFALLMLPPSQWRHIDGLIDYWIRQERQEEPIIYLSKGR